VLLRMRTQLKGILLLTANLGMAHLVELSPTQCTNRPLTNRPSTNSHLTNSHLTNRASTNSHPTSRLRINRARINSPLHTFHQVDMHLPLLLLLNKGDPGWVAWVVAWDLVLQVVLWEGCCLAQRSIVAVMVVVMVAAAVAVEDAVVAAEAKSFSLCQGQSS